MMKYIFRLVPKCLLVARKENSTGFSTGLTGWSKNLDQTGRSKNLYPTGFHLYTEYPLPIHNLFDEVYTLSILHQAIELDWLLLAIFKVLTDL